MVLGIGKNTPVLSKGDFYYKHIIREDLFNEQSMSTFLSAKHVMKAYITPAGGSKDSVNLLADAKSRVPPMLFLVTPSSMTIHYEKIITRYKTRAGWVEEHYGDKLDTISCTGVTPAYYEVPRVPSGTNETGGSSALRSADANSVNLVQQRDTGGLILPGGLHRRKGENIVPEGYAFLLRLIDIYRNNGREYDNYGNVTKLNNLTLEYMGDRYLGRFTELSVKDDAHTNPHNSNYTFSFKVTESVRKRRLDVPITVTKANGDSATEPLSLGLPA